MNLDVSRCGLGLLLALLTLVGCDKEPTPSRVEVELPPFILTPTPVQSLVWKYDANSQRTVGKGKYEYTVEPASLAAVGLTGDVTCKDSGDGKLGVSVLGVSASTVLKCRLVDHIEAPDLGRIDLNGGTVKLDIGAYTKDGKKLSDVPFLLTSPNTRVIQTKGMTLSPQMIGTATIKAQVEDVSREFSVDVVRKVEPEALPINDNTRISFSLDKGLYEVVVELDAERKLSAEWRGAPHCGYTGTAKVHTIRCDLRTDGGVVIDSPAYLASGSKDVSRAGVSIHEVPQR